jgi:hypothetical protein
MEAKHLTPKEKATELVEYFLNIEQVKLSDYSKVYLPTAKQFSLKVANEVLGYMGADRGQEFWNSVKEEINNI